MDDVRLSFVSRASGLALAGAAFFGLAPGCTTPLPLLFDAGSGLDAPGLDAPSVLPDTPTTTDGAPGLDAAPPTDAPTSLPDVPGAIGASCSMDDDCMAGSCVDGVCCSSACAGLCRGCAAALTGAPDGTCAPITAGTDPGDECLASPTSSCDTSGECDGAGACALHPAGTPCGGSAVCSSPSAVMTAAACDGAGVCEPGTRVNCGSYRCRSGACLTSCVSGADCYGTNDCVMGACIGNGDPGDACASATDCRTGYCVDGVCCRTSCPGLCMRCDGTSTSSPPGDCRPIECADPDDECSRATDVCTGTGVCGPTLTC